MAKLLSVDFETTNDINDCRVWCWGCCSVTENPSDFEWGIDIESFFTYLLTFHNPTAYFHNLKFDASFIIAYLFSIGFNHVKDKRKMPSRTFNVLMSDKGQMYQLTVCYKEGKKGNKITFLDSLKLLPFKVEQMPKAFGFDDKMVKGEINYNKPRPIGYIPDKNELSYQYRDVAIVARSLHYMFMHGMTKMTVGGNALQTYKDLIGSFNFKRWFPVLDCDEYIRNSYRGGFTYCDKRHAGKGIKTGMVFDVNSLYPWVLRSCKLPYGLPIFFTGRYKFDERYPIYVARCIIDISVKPDHIPCLQIKKSFLYGANEYIERTKEPAEVYLTSVDIKLIFEQYDVHEFIMLDGYKFQACSSLFAPFIDKYMQQKIDAEKSGNMVLRTLSKLIQNNLYGKFGTNPNVRGKAPYMGEDGVVKWELTEKEQHDSVYIPVATFVTAYARYKTITSAQKVYDRFCYADTDSLHITGTTIPECLEVDQYKLGAWKMENVFRRAKFIRQKTYIEDVWDHKNKKWKLSVTCAGMPPKCYKHVSWVNFKIGASFKGHLNHKTVVGGSVLIPNEFTIK